MLQTVRRKIKAKNNIILELRISRLETRSTVALSVNPR